MVHTLKRKNIGSSNAEDKSITGVCTDGEGGMNIIRAKPTNKEIKPVPTNKQKLSLQKTTYSVMYCASNSILNEEFVFWHTELQKGNIMAQLEIDRRLFVLSILEANTTTQSPLMSVPPKALYLEFEDTIQATNLPDLIWIFRQRLMHGVYNTALQDSIFRYSIPCIRKSKHPCAAKLFTAAQTEPLDNLCSVYINVMYGTLLALYPHCSKSPTFSIRKRLFRELYTLSVSSIQMQHDFILKNMNLVRLCFMEYFVFVLENYCNVERNLMCKCLNYDVYTNLCETSADLFRQNCLQGDSIDWTYIDHMAFKTTDKIIRTTRIGIKLSTNTGNIIGIRKLGAVWACDERTTELTRRVVLDMPPCFWHTQSMFLYTRMVTEWLQEREMDHCVTTLAHNVSIVHQMIHIYKMPTNFMMKQVQALLQHFNGDAMLLNSTCKKVVCLRCIMNIKQACNAHSIVNNTRMCLRTCTLVCNKCSNDKFLVNINMLGKFLQVERHLYFICPFCIKVHTWRGTGTEFTFCSEKSVSVVKKNNEPHARPQPKRNSKRQYSCYVCKKQSHHINMSLVDIKSFEMKHISLCSKHFIPMHSQKFIQNIDHLHKYYRGMGVQLIQN
jgi:hypothetical protein